MPQARALKKKPTPTIENSPGGAPTYDPANPLIVQSDRSILVEVDNPRYSAARDALAPFAELEKSPEHIHTYRITNLSLWNAAAQGITAEQMLAVLREFTKFPLPSNLHADLEEVVSRYGRIRLGEGGRQDAEVNLRRRAIAGGVDSPAESAGVAWREARQQELRDRRGVSRRDQTRPDQRRLSGGRRGRLRRGAALADSAAHCGAHRIAVPRPRLSTRVGRDLFRGGASTRRQRGRRVLPWRRNRQNNRRYHGHVVTGGKARR